MLQRADRPPQASASRQYPRKTPMSDDSNNNELSEKELVESGQVTDESDNDLAENDLEGDDGDDTVEGPLSGQKMSLQTLKDKTPTDLLTFAESLGVENASNMRKQDMMFAILKALAEDGVEISGSGVIEVLQD